MFSLVDTTLLDKLSDGVIGVDPSGEIVYANPLCRNWLGLQPDEPLTDGVVARFGSSTAWHALLAAGPGEARHLTFTQSQGQDGGRILEFAAAAFPQDGHTLVVLQPRFTQRDATLVQELKQQVETHTMALARERDRVRSLLRMTGELSTSLDLDRILNRALILVQEAIGGTHGAIFLIDMLTGELVFRASMGYGLQAGHEEQRYSFERGAGVIGRAVKDRSPLIIPYPDSQLAADDLWAIMPERDELTRSVLVAPLMIEEVLGVLVLLSPEPDAFRESQLDLVQAATLQVAAAVNNAELFNLIRDQADQLGSMMRADREEAAKNAAILESVADGVMVVDARGGIILFNATAERILEVERGRILGEPISQFIGLWGKAGASWAAAMDEWSHSEEIDEAEAFLAERLEMGSKVISVHLSPVMSSGEFLGTVSVFRDITRDVELDRLQREWVSTVSHELRTPMTSIKGYADLLILGAAGPVADAQRRFLEIIKNNADRLSSLVNDILDISRIETGRVKLDLGPVNLYELLDTVEANLRGRREQEDKDVGISSELPDDLPLVRGDLDRVTQILTNLLDNAFNYTPVGGSITIRARWLADKRLVQVSVRDTGIGISPEDQIRILERFYRAEHPEVQEVSGTGLGLAIVHQLVEMHGGKLTVYSEGIGQGSEFSFTLPLVEDKVETDG